MKPKNQFGTVFKVIRHAQGMTQEDFALESGRTYISELERGLKQPTLQKIDSLAIPLCLHPATLVFMAYLEEHSESSANQLLELIRSQANEILTRITAE